MKHIIIATAGHVDHGKTAIIKALTGVDTDRLKEEKKRGISIDLGFAALRLGGGLTAGIVDVPGHERFLKNMLAGTGAIDLAVLVVAADESVMPQTKEHLDILDLLGVKHGIIAVNKTDKVDLGWLELVEDEIAGLVKGTFLEGAPLCRVSAATGQGLESLTATILQMAEKIPVRDEDAPFRLWIDRVFSAKGYGAVVTGSVLSGQVSPGDNLVIYPLGKPVRVRGLEAHEQKADVLKAGQRAAINLSGVDTAEVARGMSLSAPERGETSRIWDVKVNWHKKIETKTKSATRIRLHIGTEEVLGRVYKYKDAGPDYMRLILEKPLTAAVGDRGILRLYSPQTLLGAATLLAVGSLSRKFSPSRLLIEQALVHSKNDLAAIITGRLTGGRRLKTLRDIARLSAYHPDKEIEQTVNKMVREGKLAQMEGGYLLNGETEAIAQNASGILREFHAKNSQESGMGKEILRQRLRLDEKTFENLLAYWQKEGGADLTTTGGGSQIAQKSHTLRHDIRKQDLADKSQSFLKDIGLNNVDPGLVGAKLGLDPREAKTAHDMLVKVGKLVKIGALYLPTAAIDSIIRLVQSHFAQNQNMTIGEFKDITNASRRTAVPLMEYLDAQKYTVRRGDVRKPTTKLLNFEASQSANTPEETDGNK